MSKCDSPSQTDTSEEEKGRVLSQCDSARLGISCRLRGRSS